MADLLLRHPLDGALEPDARGAQGEGRPAVTITDRRGLACVQVVARRDRAGALAQRLAIGGEPGRVTITDAFTALPLAPGQWLLIAASGRDGAFAREMSAQAGELGAVVDQSHGRTVLRLVGAPAAEILARGCRLDLHPRAFGSGTCAQTVIAQIGVLLHRIDETPAFDLIVASGYAVAFLEWLSTAAAADGCRLEVEGG